MSSLSDLMQPSAVSPQFGIAEDNIQGGYASQDAGLASGRLATQYGIGMKQEASNEAAKGSFYSGQAGVRADQSKMNYNNQQSDISRQLQRTLADLTRNRLYASLGVNAFGGSYGNSSSQLGTGYASQPGYGTGYGG